VPSSESSRDRPPTDDLYAVLGVTQSADEHELRAAWRARARESHPDVAAGPAAEDRMRRVNLAWEWLGTPERRRDYDRSRHAAETSAQAPSADPAGRADPPSKDGPPHVHPQAGARRLVAASVAAVLLVVGAVAGLVAVNGGGAGQGSGRASAPRATTFVMTAQPDRTTETAGAVMPTPSAPGGGESPPPTAGVVPPPSTAPAASEPAMTLHERPLTMTAADAPPECRTRSPTALRLDADIDRDGVVDSIFFLGPCPDLSGGVNAADHVLGPYIYASQGTPGWHLLDGAGPLAAGWQARSAFVGLVMPAGLGVSDLGVELVGPVGQASAVAVYRVEGGRARGIWDSLRDGRTWQDATFAYAPTPGAADPSEGALLLVDSGPQIGRMRETWQWVVTNGPLELVLRRTEPVPSP
jgi:hypothetical protein